MSSDSFWGNIRVSAVGSEQTVSTLYDKVTSALQAMVPWYGRFATFNFAKLFLSILGVLSAILAVLGVALALYLGKPGNLIGDGRTFFVVFCIFGYALMTGEALNWLRRKLFPLAVFAIGSGVRRHEIADWWRKMAISTIVIGGVVVGGAVNFGVSALMK